MSTNFSKAEAFVKMLEDSANSLLALDFYECFAPDSWNIDGDDLESLIVDTLEATPARIFCINRFGGSAQPRVSRARHENSPNIQLRESASSARKHKNAPVNLKQFPAAVASARHEAIVKTFNALPLEFYYAPHIDQERELACEADLAELIFSETFVFVQKAINLLLEGKTHRRLRIRGQRMATSGRRIYNDNLGVESMDSTMDHCLVTIDPTALTPEAGKLVSIIEEKGWNALRNCEWGELEAACIREKRPQLLEAFPNIQKIVPQVMKYMHEGKSPYTSAIDGFNNYIVQWRKSDMNIGNAAAHEAQYLRVGDDPVVQTRGKKNPGVRAFLDSLYEGLVMLAIEAVQDFESLCLIPDWPAMV